MKSSVPKPVIAAIVALAVIALVFVFVRAGGDAAPQVSPSALPDYSKMTPEQINAAHNETPGNGGGTPAPNGTGRG